MPDNESPPQPDPALRRLDRLVGTWNMEGNRSARARIDFAGLQIDALELIGYDPETDTFPSTVYPNVLPDPCRIDGRSRTTP